jgi:RNA polymerase sigma-70 factor (ECF subfamily)
MSEDPETQSRRWLAEIAQGREQALEQFYRHYHAPVFHFAQRLVNNTADAAEIVNETMLEVWRAAARFAGESRVRTWLFGIVNHRAIDLLRRRRRNVTDEIEDIIDESPGCSITELSYPEVAQALNVPVGTIKTRVMHAKLRLQQCLAGRFAESRGLA